MGVFYKNFVKPLIFRLDPEKAHEVAVDALSLLSHMPFVPKLMANLNQLGNDYAPVEICGIDFPNRVGLAAGFDKNAVCWPAFEALGFGHVEIGTVTLLAQPGNPKPRMFRYPEHQAILNRMGFNNDGAEAVAQRLSRTLSKMDRRIPLGVNIGKSKAAPLDEAVEDYKGSFQLLADFADYVVINVSSPNTPDLRKLQEETRLRELLSTLVSLNLERDQQPGQSRKPIFLKVAPDLSLEQLDAIIATLLELNLDGIIATNTTMAREGPFENIDEPGGISGKPVDAMSTEIIAHAAKTTSGNLPIIGVGGITDPDSAKRKIDAGASLVQIYSGMIFEGPFLGKRIAKALV